MQQTTKYQFNLVDATDDFSPTPLNQNAQKTEDLIEGVEEDLAALETQISGQLDELEEALGSGGHTCRIAWGSYTGTGSAGSGSPNTLTFDFRPMVILFATEASFHCWPGIFYNGIEVGKSCVINDSFFIYVTWQGHSVSWYSRDNNEEFQMNASNRTYFYVALGYDDSEA